MIRHHALLVVSSCKAMLSKCVCGCVYGLASVAAWFGQVGAVSG